MPQIPLPIPQDDTDRTLLEHIAQYGWTIVAIEEDEEGPGFAYSIGFYHTLDHPEVLILGLKPPEAQKLINALGEMIRGGQHLRPSQRYDAVAGRCAMTFVPLDPEHYRTYLGYARW